MASDAYRRLAADGVVVRDGRILLLERNHPPHEGDWVLPGGFVERDETAAEAAVREVREETGLDVVLDEFVGLYDAPGRDERGTVSAAYRCRPETDAAPEPVEEASAVEFVHVDAVPALGFDHAAILEDALPEREL